MDELGRKVLLHAMMDASPLNLLQKARYRVKRGYRRYEQRDWLKHPLFPLYDIDIHICEDAKRESKAGLCELWEKLGYCQFAKHIMKRFCRKTCGFCKAPAPLKCHSSKYGCCWDKRTEALGPNGKGCPYCYDVYPHSCGQFDDYCHKRGRNGRFIRYHCFKRCGACEGRKHGRRGRHRLN
ncbi:uncharacterized protein LOC116619011 isoform X2 [Nematostella vectensis]|nr:uncharacterized protein LOC116619011 isoform X2 [Nematostella vectensis]